MNKDELKSTLAQIRMGNTAQAQLDSAIRELHNSLIKFAENNYIEYKYYWQYHKFFNINIGEFWIEEAAELIHFNEYEDYIGSNDYLQWVIPLKWLFISQDELQSEFNNYTRELVGPVIEAEKKKKIGKEKADARKKAKEHETYLKLKQKFEP